MRDSSAANRVRIDLGGSLLSFVQIESMKSHLAAGQQRLESPGEDFTGWVRLPKEFNKQELRRIKETAEAIRHKCDAFVVIGIGGSYLGARAAIEMLADKGAGPAVYYAGHNVSGTYHAKLLEELQGKDVCICVISKSGTTIESNIAFALLKDLLAEKYGKEKAAERIYAITDPKSGTLRQEAEREGYESFAVPENIGGRYSVLTPVGLLPISVAGIDIDAMLSGAAEISDPLPFEEDGAAQYAAARNLLFSMGKVIEIFEICEPGMEYFSEWLKQLFGESEGKQGKGIFPASLQLSTDLHSLGQFLQEGNQIFFETILNVESPPRDMVVPESADESLAGLSMNQVNRAVVLGMMAAHQKAGIPMIRVDVPAMTPYYFGQLVYFFERACTLSGYLAGVNPFDQPGVEKYKAEMRKILSKL
ncbi:MAG TPA: glucose-6-phosphate isomerase [Bacillota bacterium]|jgi:glucose-6-phosphate isomerase|nr:glucose-6-phosphate isomerase [Clostridiales bacterium UBA9856]HOA42004.1 glucose-6-phosphate isomerase [Bacillota bacterium]HPZ59534.1 glucose-6-phosphate isomerase [Bacillota bacterium]HQC82920.1 glucose-6-phosphate isomerase [Bacillota bacterium]